MSASGKLKALTGGAFWEQPDDVILERLSDALPQIVAVVEAAEQFQRVDQPSWNLINKRLAAVLRALEEALS